MTLIAHARAGPRQRECGVPTGGKALEEFANPHLSYHMTRGFGILFGYSGLGADGVKNGEKWRDRAHEFNKRGRYFP
jgi:cytochrome oxidase assembly protein ShyY1